MPIAADLLRIHKPVRPLVSVVIAFRKWVVAAARPIGKGIPAELIGVTFRKSIVVARLHGYAHSGIKRASRQAFTKAVRDASIGILCETAAKHFSLASA